MAVSPGYLPPHPLEFGVGFLLQYYCIALAVSGLLHPILSALAMVLSNLMVVGNSMALYRFKGVTLPSYATETNPANNSTGILYEH